MALPTLISLCSTCYFFILLLYSVDPVMDLSVFSSHCCPSNMVICKGPFLNSLNASLYTFSTLECMITMFMAFQKIFLTPPRLSFTLQCNYFQLLVTLNVPPYLISTLSTKLPRHRKPVFLSSFLTSLNCTTLF